MQPVCALESLCSAQYPWTQVTTFWQQDVFLKGAKRLLKTCASVSLIFSLCVNRRFDEGRHVDRKSSYWDLPVERALRPVDVVLYQIEKRRGLISLIFYRFNFIWCTWKVGCDFHCSLKLINFGEMCVSLCFSFVLIFSLSISFNLIDDLFHLHSNTLVTIHSIFT